MVYNSIFSTKPKKENKKQFCNRIATLLNSIYFCDDGYIGNNNGLKMLNTIFRYNKFNNGYSNINDLLMEANVNYRNIFKLCEMDDINEDEMLSNIDIITNCLCSFKENDKRYYYDSKDAKKTVLLIFEAISQYLLRCGYKLVYDEEDNRFLILENEIAVDVNEIEDEKIRRDVIEFYNYKNTKDLGEKKKIILILAGNLESRKNEIGKILGTKIADMLSNYINNFNLRHNNISENFKSKYRKTISELNEDDMLKWYDYIYAFMINIYLSLDKLKEVNINNDYK